MDDEIELLGALMDEQLFELGARRGVSRRGGSRNIARARAQAAYVNRLQPNIPGVPSIGARQAPLGLGSFTFVNAGVVTFQFLVNPQRPFKGARLVADVRRSAAAIGQLPVITQFVIGSDNQLVGTGELPLEAFAPDAVDIGLALSPATPGINIAITVALNGPALGVGDTIACSLMLIGQTIGS